MYVCLLNDILRNQLDGLVLVQNVIFNKPQFRTRHTSSLSLPFTFPIKYAVFTRTVSLFNEKDTEIGFVFPKTTLSRKHKINSLERVD